MISFSWSLLSATSSGQVFSLPNLPTTPRGPGDIGLFWGGGSASVAVLANDLATDDGLGTAVFLSLYLDRRAEAGDVLPVGVTDRRGWWADAVPVVDGDQIGSRLWLLERSKQTPDVLDRAVKYARESLQWLLDDSVCETFDVTAEFIAGPADDRGVGGLGLVVTVHRPSVDPTRFRFDHAWTAEESRQ